MKTLIVVAALSLGVLSSAFLTGVSFTQDTNGTWTIGVTPAGGEGVKDFHVVLPSGVAPKGTPGGGPSGWNGRKYAGRQGGGWIFYGNTALSGPTNFTIVPESGAKGLTNYGAYWSTTNDGSSQPGSGRQRRDGDWPTTVVDHGAIVDEEDQPRPLPVTTSVWGPDVPESPELGAGDEITLEVRTNADDGAAWRVYIRTARDYEATSQLTYTGYDLDLTALPSSAWELSADPVAGELDSTGKIFFTFRVGENSTVGPGEDVWVVLALDSVEDPLGEYDCWTEPLSISFY